MRQKIEKRYPFWRVVIWSAGINILLEFFGLFVIAFVKVPDQTYTVQDVTTVNSLLQFAQGTVFNIIFFYFTLNYFHKLIVQQKQALNYVGYCFLVLVLCAIYFVVSHKCFGTITKNKVPVSTELLIFSTSFVAIILIGLSLLIAYLNSLRDDKKLQKILEIQNLQANYNFLKAQINPHFLHNTLNFFYAKSLPYSEELSEGILTLSEIMRYALSKENAIDGKILLKDEIEHLRNVIKINQLRFSNNLHVIFKVHGAVGEVMMIPFVLITIVENAFKHGDLKNPDYPIDIKLTVVNDSLTFLCRNKKKTGPKELSTGIGLDNTKKRLDMVYATKYTINIIDETDFYTTELIIKKL
ncbi:MAG: histidine kinase [Deinococcales bacterium]|nr:histidine kinase [Chitinophagaceae bacterium]